MLLSLCCNSDDLNVFCLHVDIDTATVQVGIQFYWLILKHFYAEILCEGFLQ